MCVITIVMLIFFFFLENLSSPKKGFLMEEFLFFPHEEFDLFFHFELIGKQFLNEYYPALAGVP